MRYMDIGKSTTLPAPAASPSLNGAYCTNSVCVNRNTTSTKTTRPLSLYLHREDECCSRLRLDTALARSVQNWGLPVSSAKTAILLHRIKKETVEPALNSFLYFESQWGDNQ